MSNNYTAGYGSGSFDSSTLDYNDVVTSVGREKSFVERFGKEKVIETPPINVDVLGEQLSIVQDILYSNHSAIMEELSENNAELDKTTSAQFNSVGEDTFKQDYYIASDTVESSYLSDGGYLSDIFDKAMKYNDQLEVLQSAAYLLVLEEQVEAVRSKYNEYKVEVDASDVPKIEGYYSEMYEDYYFLIIKECVSNSTQTCLNRYKYKIGPKIRYTPWDGSGGITAIDAKITECKKIMSDLPEYFSGEGAENVANYGTANQNSSTAIQSGGVATPESGTFDACDADGNIIYSYNPNKGGFM